MFIEKSKSLMVSEDFFELLDKRLENKKIEGQYEPFNNNREHGLVLSVYDEKNSINIWACECRNSDQIMVVIGGDYEKDINNMWSGKVWENAKYFDVDDYDSAVNYAYNVIKLNFKDKMKEVNFKFELFKSMEDIERYDIDIKSLDEDDLTVFATYIDIPEKLCCDLDIRDNEWYLTIHVIDPYDNYRPIEMLEAIKITPDLKDETSLMMQMKKELDSFIDQELEYTVGNPKI